MTIDATRSTLSVKVGTAFTAADVDRLREALSAFGPISTLTIDFSAARQCEDAMLLRLADELSSPREWNVALRGLTPHQSRLLRYLGFDPDGTHTHQA